MKRKYGIWELGINISAYKQSPGSLSNVFKPQAYLKWYF